MNKAMQLTLAANLFIFMVFALIFLTGVMNSNLVYVPGHPGMPWYFNLS